MSRRVLVVFALSAVLAAIPSMPAAQPAPRIDPALLRTLPDAPFDATRFDRRLVLRTCPASAVVADVVAIDHPMVFNRLGAQNINWMMYALRHDVIDQKTQHPLNYSTRGESLFAEVSQRNDSRSIALRPDLRPRPLVLRVAAGGYLRVRFTNLLELKASPPHTTPGNPFRGADPLPNVDHPMERAAAIATDPVSEEVFHIDDQVASRTVGFHPQGLELFRMGSDSSFVGVNASSLAAPGETREYCFRAPEEGAFFVSSAGAAFGGEGSAGNSGAGLFGAVVVEPVGARFYRSQLTEEEMRLATRGRTADGQPVVDYEATYPNDCPTGIWCREGKAGMPILNMLAKQRIVHGEVNANIVGPNADGSFPPDTYPLERSGRRNPTVPNRLEPFREFVSIFHDENAATQVFPYFFEHPELGHTLHGVRDAFMINYGSGGVGAEIIANRLRAGPMQDCLDCAYEEFFLSSFAVGDVATLVDKPLNLAVGRCQPEYLDPARASEIDPHTGRSFEEMRKATCVQDADEQATRAYYPHDPANVHHSYIGDFVKFRNVHAGKEQHIFHLHNHQWLFNANDDNANYIDAQGLGPGSGYTYEIAFGGSGNRNRTVGDAIFHCHFYPHFAQGMWYLWRIHDVMESGTPLAVSTNDTGFHDELWGLRDGRPAPKSRALPDGEIVAGTPIPAVVPLPGKGMAPMPEPVHVVPRSSGPGSQAELLGAVDRETRNPGYPFWVAGVTRHDVFESAIGHRPTTPPLDMDAGAGGFDGGLPRHAMSGYAAGGDDEWELSRLSAAKHMTSARPIWFPETGTALERVAMRFHSVREHPSSEFDLAGAVTPSVFGTNGAPPTPGAPYNEPCIDDDGKLLVKGGDGSFFGGAALDGRINASAALPGGIEFGATNPRIYQGANIQLDVVFNKLGYHYPQQRILALWQDVGPTLDNKRAPEPLVLRMNTFDCAMYQHTNLVPKDFYADDYQITTPTDVIGQHIHLPKWDLTSADGSANGWNYEDGTFSPGMVRERIHAINAWNATQRAGGNPGVPNPYTGNADPLVPRPHPYFGALAGHQSPNCVRFWNELDGDAEAFDKKHGFPRECDWLGARTTLQRWFSDPIVNTGGVHRGLGITFTHDHLGPSTHQQIGLYATMLTEPPGAEWRHNETGTLLGTRSDGGPTTWQAIISGKGGRRIDVDGDRRDDAHREFFLQFGDFQHAYLRGVYVGVTREGKNPYQDPAAKPTTETFRSAINPSLRKPASPNFPDIAEFRPDCPGGQDAGRLPNAVYNSVKPPLRPCPEAISADDVGMMVVNYRNEPVAARVYDPSRKAPDGGSGMQASGFAGDMAYALQTRTDRRCEPMNWADGNVPFAAASSNPVCRTDGTPNTPYTRQTRAHDGDPFTPILRLYSGDLVRVKVQAGSHEHEHNGTINGIGWMQGGSGYGQAAHSGWRNAQNTGLSEQFTFTARITDHATRNHETDRLYAMDSSQDGLWTGVWGVIRSLNQRQPTVDRLQPLPSNRIPSVLGPFECPSGAPVRLYDVTAVLANDALKNSLGVNIPNGPAGTSLDPMGGTLVYNPRRTAIQIQVHDEETGALVRTERFGSGPLHDPTAILFVRSEDLDGNGQVMPGRPVEPLVLRAAAGECVRITLRNRLPRSASGMPDLDGYSMLTAMLPRSMGAPGNSMTSFNNNLIRPSNRIGLHPQLVHYDVQSYDGNNVGVNRRSTVAPGRSMIFQWYAGVFETIASAESCPTLPAAEQQKAFDLLNAMGGQPWQRPLNEVLDAEAFAQIAQAVLDPQAEEGSEPSDRIAGAVKELVAIAGDSGCLETPESGATPQFVDQPRFALAANTATTRTAVPPARRFAALDPRRISAVEATPATRELLADAVRTAEFADEAPLAPETAAHVRTRILAQRNRCGSSPALRDRFEGIVRSLAPNDAPRVAQQLTAAFIDDVPAIDDAADRQAAFRWLADARILPLSVDTTRLVGLRPASEINAACRMVAVEFGGTNLTPPDRIKQGQKAAVGALVIEPEGARWREFSDDDAIDRQDPGPAQANRRRTRATADVAYPVVDAAGVKTTALMRDLVVVHQKGLNFRYAKGDAVANLAAERTSAHDLPDSIAPEDAHDAGHMAINYGSEPMWFRFGLPPDAPFGKDGFAGIRTAWQGFSNTCCGNGGTATSADANVGEPYVPILRAYAGYEARMRLLMPTGVGRATVFNLHGHAWPRDPHLAERVDSESFPAGSRPADWGVPSKCIGSNPQAKFLGGQESLTPMAHFDVVLAAGKPYRTGGAGGRHATRGDFVWRDMGGFGITNGLWGVLRVVPAETTAPVVPLRRSCAP